jgi:hypothetical protein
MNNEYILSAELVPSNVIHLDPLACLGIVSARSDEANFPFTLCFSACFAYSAVDFRGILAVKSAIVCL